ncbi:MAG: 2-aminoethylphosphonate--pyruvate transaminase [Spirochaetales bacterium]|nr:2-aminoethylphosphonate--pyruvate transaminase [Spirochaetales bacterium]
MTKIPGWKDKILFTPGPLTTSNTVKQAMLRDLGSRDIEFISTVQWIRDKLLELGGVSNKGYEAILMQGSGTFGIESVISSTTPDDGGWLVIVNGAYGHRLAQIVKTLNLQYEILKYAEDQVPVPQDVAEALDKNPDISNVGIVHCETSTGMFNPIEEIGVLVGKRRKVFFVDAMSSFGAVPIDIEKSKIDYLVSSANKCIEGVPGFSFIIANYNSLEKIKSFSRSIVLDLYAQWKGLEKNGQFRFTPPTHSILAFAQAIRELIEEGGVEGRAGRYIENYETLIRGMESMGFKTYLPKEARGYIITSFRYPESGFDFTAFIKSLGDKDIVIYPGKVSNADCFRIGNIGRIFKADVHNLLNAIKASVEELNISLS